jgi:hypothetical protein
VDVGEMQRRLSHTAAKDPEHQFGDLYSLLCNEVWLRVAVHHVQQNTGSETAGIDGKTMANFRGNFDGYIEELKTTLKAETFNPKDADRLGNIQIVCTNCHRAKTQNDLRVLSRMRSKPQVRF